MAFKSDPVLNQIKSVQSDSHVFLQGILLEILDKWHSKTPPWAAPLELVTGLRNCEGAKEKTGKLC